MTNLSTRDRHLLGRYREAMLKVRESDTPNEMMDWAKACQLIYGLMDTNCQEVARVNNTARKFIRGIQKGR